jgi:hypothetical protein
VRAKAKLGVAASSAQGNYTAEQYAAAACMILDGSGACSKQAAEARLGSIAAARSANPVDKQRAGQAVLEAMQAANAITMDYWWPSTLGAAGALSMPGTAGLGQVVTAPNAFDFYCWQRMEGELRGIAKAGPKVSHRQ